MKKNIIKIVVSVIAVLVCFACFSIMIEHEQDKQNKKLKEDISEVASTMTTEEIETSEDTIEITSEEPEIISDSKITEVDSTEATTIATTEVTTEKKETTTEKKTEKTTEKKKEEKKTTQPTTQKKTEATTESVITESVTTEQTTETPTNSNETESTTTEVTTEVTTEKPTEKTTEKKENDDPYCGLSASDFNDICKVVECETHGADTTSKMHIVNVIRNRKNDSRFPNSYHAVIYQANQFGHRSGVTEHTKEAVRKALRSADNTGGATWFCTCSRGCWASRHATRLFKDDVGHIFWK